MTNIPPSPGLPRDINTVITRNMEISLKIKERFNFDDVTSLSDYDYDYYQLTDVNRNDFYTLSNHIKNNICFFLRLITLLVELYY